MRRQQRETMGRKYERERRRKVGGGRKKREIQVWGKKPTKSNDKGKTRGISASHITDKG